MSTRKPTSYIIIKVKKEEVVVNFYEKELREGTDQK